ncbi:hypothetical protein L1787_13255 [Acuticoccus sp. M5D2P5]|nr:hypothetical protein [Acuticoccus kalidii]MCF3934373.1 hypothetical protein [Acuticoccus kalidii]
MMREVADASPDGREFEPFLYASIGEDRNGNIVTVLSTFARLGLDPWKEAAEVSTLGREAGRERLALLLSRFRDVPTLGRDYGAVAQELILLLPERSTLHAKSLAGSFVAKAPLISPSLILAILMILLIVAQVVLAGARGSGE